MEMAGRRLAALGNVVAKRKISDREQHKRRGRVKTRPLCEYDVASIKCWSPHVWIHVGIPGRLLRESTGAVSARWATSRSRGALKIGSQFSDSAIEASS